MMSNPVSWIWAAGLGTLSVLAMGTAWTSAPRGQSNEQNDAFQAQAQSAPEQPVAFDVVSIKPHKDEGMMMRIGMRITPDGFSADGVPLDNILHDAFNVPRDRILNEPDWAKSNRYDIEAKVAPEDASKLKSLDQHQRWAMLIPVLQERFAFKFHHESRELQVYTLAVAKGGPKLKAAAGADAKEAKEDAPPPKPGAQGQGAPPRGATMMRVSPQGMNLEARSATMESLIRILSDQVGSTIVDKTGLTAKYDFTLSFMPDQGVGPMGMLRGVPPPDGSAQTQDPVGPSIFTALQEQLGLKLSAQKAQVDVIVIDQIDKPSEN